MTKFRVIETKKKVDEKVSDWIESPIAKSKKYVKTHTGPTAHQWGRIGLKTLGTLGRFAQAMGVNTSFVDNFKRIFAGGDIHSEQAKKGLQRWKNKIAAGTIQPTENKQFLKDIGVDITEMVSFNNTDAIKGATGFLAVYNGESIGNFKELLKRTSASGGLFR